MPIDPSPFGLAEFAALRATIRERGTLRLIVIVITFVTWAALAATVQALFAGPVMGLLPLVVLVAGFEVVFAAHVGVERIGRYLQVFYESAGELPQWERAAMAVGMGGAAGANGPRAGIDPLCAWVFGVAILVNLVPIAMMSLPADATAVTSLSPEFFAFGGLHAAALFRVYLGRRFATGQRQRDLAKYTHMREQWLRGVSN